jgi:hypothetical protein
MVRKFAGTTILNNGEKESKETLAMIGYRWVWQEIRA